MSVKLKINCYVGIEFSPQHKKDAINVLISQFKIKSDKGFSVICMKNKQIITNTRDCFVAAL